MYVAESEWDVVTHDSLGYVDWSVMATQIYMYTVLLCNLMHSNLWTRRKFDKNTFG